MDDSTPQPTAGPTIRVSGSATPEDIAAIVSVLSCSPAQDRDAGGVPESSPWASHSAALRRPMAHGPGAWRSALRA